MLRAVHASFDDEILLWECASGGGVTCAAFPPSGKCPKAGSGDLLAAALLGPVGVHWSLSGRPAGEGDRGSLLRNAQARRGRWTVTAIDAGWPEMGARALQ